MNYSNKINAVQSYFTEISKQAANYIQSQSRTCKAGIGALVALVAADFASNANAEELYLVKRSEKPALEEKKTEHAEDFYDNGLSIITAPKTKKKKLQRLIADLSMGINAGEEISQINTGAKLIITPEGDKDAWRIITEATSRGGVKLYDEGKDLAFGEGAIAVRGGRYIDLRDFLDSNDAKAYVEAGVRAEGTVYTNRTEMENYRFLATLAAGIFLEKSGTSLKITLAAGKGEYNLLTNGTEQTDDLTRMLADLQIKQKFGDVVYGKARLNATLTDYANRAKSTAVSGEFGLGLQGKVFGIDAFVEALATARQENNSYFNGAETADAIFGAKLRMGAILFKDTYLRSGADWDEELKFNLFVELMKRL